MPRDTGHPRMAGGGPFRARPAQQADRTKRAASSAPKGAQNCRQGAPDRLPGRSRFAAGEVGKRCPGGSISALGEVQICRWEGREAVPGGFTITAANARDSPASRHGADAAGNRSVRKRDYRPARRWPGVPCEAGLPRYDYSNFLLYRLATLRGPKKDHAVFTLSFVTLKTRCAENTKRSQPNMNSNLKSGRL